MYKYFLLLLIVLVSFLSINCGNEENQKEKEQGAEAAEEQVVTEKQQVVSVEDLQNKVQEVYDSTHKAIANITTTMVTPGSFSAPMPQQGAGSGFLWDDEGHIVTNYHVVRNAKSITVSLTDNEMREAELIGSDPFTDLAVLKISSDNLAEPLELYDSDGLDVGQFVVALGNPFSFDQTMTFGIISALGRIIQSSGGGLVSEAIQTDTPINPGNSGGPLLDMNGKVIGVNSAIISPSGASAGIGFAISSNTVSKVIPSLIEDGDYPHPWLGIQSLNLTERFAQVLKKAGVNVPVNRGVLIVNVLSNGPADKADLEGGDRQLQLGNLKLPVGGDILVQIDEKTIETYKDLVVYLETKTEIGDTVTVTFYRDGSKNEEEVTIGARPEELKVSS